MSRSARGPRLVVLPSLVLGVVLGLVLALVAGCSSDTAKSPRPKTSSGAPDKALEKGTCWDAARLPDALGADAFDAWVEKYAAGDAALADAMRDDAAFRKEVDCTEPHSLELYNVVEVEPALTARITEYSALLDQDSPLYRKVRDQVNDRCLAGSVYGRAQRRGGGIPVQLGPALDTDAGLHVAWDPFPADLWEKGQRKFVCTFEQVQPGTLRFADLTTSKVPVAARVCLNTPGTYVSCAGRHQAEDIGEMILNTAIEKGAINGRKAVRQGPKGKYVALSDAEYARLDKICGTLLRQVSSVRGGVQARAYPGSVAQWPTDTGVYVASCFALKPDQEPPPPITGTVFDRG
jgi:hypothetical protein